VIHRREVSEESEDDKYSELSEDESQNLAESKNEAHPTIIHVPIVDVTEPNDVSDDDSAVAIEPRDSRPEVVDVSDDEPAVAIQPRDSRPEVTDVFAVLGEPRDGKPEVTDDGNEISGNAEQVTNL
jgi:hypothetical protein